MKRGLNTFLLGESGSGKTQSAATLALCPNIEKVFFVFTEPSEATFSAHSFPKEIKALIGKKLHYCHAAPVKMSTKDLLDVANKVIKLTRKGLGEAETLGPPSLRQGFITFLNALDKFKCAVTGETFPPIDEWPPEWALVVDSLSGLNVALRYLVVGSKPTLAPYDWGSAMCMEEDIIMRLVGGTDATVCITAHLSRERDEVLGSIIISPDALGAKLGPRLPRLFDEVIMCKQSGDDYFWSTKELRVALKHRILPLANELPPDFRELYRRIEGPPQPEETPTTTKTHD